MDARRPGSAATNLDANSLRQRLDVVEGEIGPGTGAIEEESIMGVSFGLSLSVGCLLRHCERAKQSISQLADAWIASSLRFLAMTA